MKGLLKAASILGILFAASIFGANAQRPDCPVRGAPMPMSPPGKTPDFYPKVTFPSHPDGEVKIEPMGFLPREAELAYAEEGHVTALMREAEAARTKPPGDEVLRELVDVRRTLLSEWQFLGYVPDEPAHKVPRAFSRNGSVIIFEQWNMAADGASILATAAPSLMIGRFPAVQAGLRSPSGCVLATLSWHGEGMSYSLQIAGPLSHPEQRELLVSIARSIDAAASTTRH